MHRIVTNDGTHRDAGDHDHDAGDNGNSRPAHLPDDESSSFDHDDYDNGDDDSNNSNGNGNGTMNARIFRSGLCDMFQSPEASKTDTCAVFCCGIYLWQRNADLLMREQQQLQLLHQRDQHEDDDNDDDYNYNDDPFDDCDSQSPSMPRIWSAMRRWPFETGFVVVAVAFIVLESFDDPRNTNGKGSNHHNHNNNNNNNNNNNHWVSTSSSVLGLILVIATICRLIEFQRSRCKFRKQLAVAEFYRRRRRRRRRDTTTTTTTTTNPLDDNNNDDDDDDGENNNSDDTNDDPELVAFLRTHHREIYGNGAHAFCGFCRSNAGWLGTSLGRRRNTETTTAPPGDDTIFLVDDNDDDNDETNHNRGFCITAWRFLANGCCGFLCGCHLQLCGMCAIAQESRHLRDVIPPGLTSSSFSSSSFSSSSLALWQRDYLTFQPWSEYYPSILRLRFSERSHCLPHFRALSKLSRRILVGSIAFLLFVTILFLFPIRFPKWQVLIFYGTLLQPVVFLLVVHWMWNRGDLSFDAVVKYFACGFFICTSSTLVYEWFVSIVARKFVLLVDKLAYKGLEWFEASSSLSSSSYNDPTYDTLLANEIDVEPQPHHGRYGGGGGGPPPLWYQLALASFRALVDAFFVAAMTEEICKYLCFWMVEHPDLELRNKVLLSPSSPSPSPSPVVPLCATNESSTPETSGEENDEDTETTGLLVARTRGPSAYDPEQQHQQQVVFAPVAPLVSIGEGITVAMVTVALGLACAENLLYIFVYTPKNLMSEVSTLYVRCLLPIHPMAAALQSIGVCRRDLEKDSSYGIGWIIFPAWLLHGSFDASLMAFSAIKKILERHNVLKDYGSATSVPGIEPGGGEAVDVDDGLPFAVYVTLIPCIAMIYFLNESFYQRERLEQLDRDNRIQTAT